ncbi:MAG TPA: NAD-dependent epimerase/dehydratase family protein [Thermoleophilaceae bacterium]|nr:NAD-dependent epimerase/dehydratase family protein [Thermoleophilaceae bacterium]
MATDGLKVTVTGPTGDLGIALVDALERSRRVKRIVGMARRPFDPASQGWKKTEYREGDVQDKRSVAEAVKGADVVVHLAFAILESSDRTRGINVDGSRNVFEAAVAAGAERVCYASSVAAYGFHADNPDWLTEDVAPRGSEAHFYSAQKAEVEGVLGEVLLRTERTQAWVFRPCIVAGPTAQTMIEEIPYVRMSQAMPDPVRRLLSGMPVLKPVIPDPGVPFQLVHEDDVAQAFVAGALGRGEPGPYNLAANGKLTISDLADALGWYSIPIPDLAVGATAEVVSRLPARPPVFSWLESVRKPVLMKTDRARKVLGWKPKHTSKGTLKELVAAYRDEQRF